MLAAAHKLPGPGEDDQGEAAEPPGGPAGARSPGGSPAEHVGLGEGRAGQAGLCRQHGGEQRRLGETAVTNTGACLRVAPARLPVSKD